MNISIVNLKRSLPDNVVLSAEWKMSYTDGEFTESYEGSVDLPLKNASDDSFIPFESLSESQVVEWVKTQCGEDNMNIWYEELKTKVQNQKTPLIANGLPWAN
jgi:hypothetical protein